MNKTLLLKVGVIVLGVVMVASVVAFVLHKNYDYQEFLKWRGWQGDASQNELYLAEQFLQEYGVKLRNETSINQLFPLTDTNKTLVFNRMSGFNENQLRQLEAWVAKGGRIVFEVDGGYQSDEDEDEDETATDKDSAEDENTDEAEYTLTLTDLLQVYVRDSVNPCEQFQESDYYYDDYYFDDPSQDYSDKCYFETATEVDHNTDKIPCECTYDYKDQPELLSVLDLNNGIYRYDLNHSGLDLFLWPEAEQSFTHHGITHNTPSTLIILAPAADYGDIFIEVKHGKGSALIFSERFYANFVNSVNLSEDEKDNSPMQELIGELIAGGGRYSDSGISAADHASLLLYMASPELLQLNKSASKPKATSDGNGSQVQRTMVWYQYVEYDSLFVLLKRAIPEVLFSLLLILFVFLWRGFSRFGTLLQVGEKHDRNLLSHIKASGDYYWRENHARNLIQEQRAAVQKILLKKSYMSHSADEARIVQNLAEKTGIDASVFHTALYAPVQTEQTFRNTMKSIQTIKQAMRR